MNSVRLITNRFLKYMELVRHSPEVFFVKLFASVQKSGLHQTSKTPKLAQCMTTCNKRSQLRDCPSDARTRSTFVGYHVGNSMCGRMSCMACDSVVVRVWEQPSEDNDGRGKPALLYSHCCIVHDSGCNSSAARNATGSSQPTKAF